MKVRRFETTRVHGYMDLDVSFNPDITFLTGINGSGKTTVVNGISALISPSFAYLAETRYEKMKVEIEVDGVIVAIWAERDGEILTLGSSLDAQSLTIPVLGGDAGSGARVAERDMEYYREQEARNSPHPVMKRLKALPTPMFLGLDRRSASLFPTEVHGLASATWRRRSHNVFSTSLSRSLLEAAALAEQSYSGVQAQLRDLTDGLRKQFVLSAMQYASVTDTKASLPSIEPHEVARVKSTLRDLGLTDDQIARHVDPFVEKLKEMVAYAPFDEDFTTVLSGQDQKKSQAYVEWFTNRPQFDRLTRLLKQVDRFVSQSQKASAPLDNYIQTVNNFLNDSGKQLRFDRTGNLIVTIGGGTGRGINALSSGESQIVVILTHLAFNPSARSANVFIVDEPELSLHLRWQELFVPAIKTLNPLLQTILATHSPAIILEDLEHCVDLSSTVQ